MGKKLKSVAFRINRLKEVIKFNIIMNIADEIITHVADFIDKYRYLPEIKFSFILGKYSSNFGFERHLFHEEKYIEIKLFLESCTSWENIENYEMDINEESECVDNIVIVCKNGSYDLCVCVYKDTNFSGTQKQIRYSKKNHAFNLSMVYNKLNEIFYTFDITANVPSNYSSIYISHSSLLKICDILIKVNNTHDLYLEIIK
jgi:hypothetical protein